MSDLIKERTTRRQFLSTSAAAASATAVFAGPSVKARPNVNARVIGANDRINLGFIGCGMRFLPLANGFLRRKESKGDVELMAVCDVWEPRLKNGLERSKAQKGYRDYKEVLARKDIDGVVISSPDHWHYLQAAEACRAGKDVYLEKPMTYTVEEAAKLNDLVNKTERVLQVGGSGPASGLYWKVNEYLSTGKMGKILWGLISYNRNAREGMWDYPIPGIGNQRWPDAEVSPRNLDWKMWLGPAPNRPFSPERYFRWRKYWDYSGGNAGDLLYHRLGMMSVMIKFDFPTKVTGAGGIYVQKDREVPDTYMTMVEYPDDYCINMISCMGNSQSAPLTIYGNWGTLQIVQQSMPEVGDSMGDQNRPPARTGGRGREFALVKAERTFAKEFKEANGGQTEVKIEGVPHPGLDEDWLDCMRSRKSPVYNVLRGYQVMTAIKLGVESYRQGKVLEFDPVKHQLRDALSPRKVFIPKGA